MAKHVWNLESLKSQLSRHPDIKFWIVWQENIHRRERYFMMDGGVLIADQDRDVHEQNIEVKIAVKLQKEGRQGEISKKFFLSVPLQKQIDSAVSSALQTDHQAWDLPRELPTQVSGLLTTDPQMAEDLEKVMGELTSEIQSSVVKKRKTSFNSSELFLSVHHYQTHLSNGLIHRSSQSRIYTEAAYSFTQRDLNGKARSDEYLSTRWSVARKDLPIERLFDETSDRAQHSLDVVKPQTGKYPVIIDSEVLATLFNNHVTQLSSINAYHGLPFVKPGDALIPNAVGDLISIVLDPSLEFGADSVAVSGQGLVQRPFKLVDANQVVATATDKRYADYLGVPTTAVHGNVVIEPGKMTHQELTRFAPIVIEVLQFSGLFADPNSGTFGSEIRLAKLYDNEAGTVSYLKGGSLSGSFVENFRDARFSSSRVKRSHFTSGTPKGEGYYGPEFALLSDVSIVG